MTREEILDLPDLSEEQVRDLIKTIQEGNALAVAIAVACLENTFDELEEFGA